MRVITEPADAPEHTVPVPREVSHLRRYAMDGALLLFDRRTGLTAICDGEETQHLTMRAPRVVQFGITNACNLACSFCSRDVAARSSWTSESAFQLLADLDRAGTLEVAFGGGEPFAFKGFPALVERLHRETQLAVSVTTNGTLLTPAIAAQLSLHAAQVRVSIYDDNDWRAAIRTLVDANVTVGANYLITPARLLDVESITLELVALGCRDVLLLSYNGRDASMHLEHDAAAALASRILLLARALAGRTTIKLDVCWGERMESVPRLFGERNACGAGREPIVITSDRRIAPCSFHHLSYPITSARDVLDVWSRERDAMASAARDPGCARAPSFGLRDLRSLLRGGESRP